MIEVTYGKAERIWVMNRGIPTEDVLREMRDPGHRLYNLGGHAEMQDREDAKRWLE
jgi:hypothetical protein